MGLKKQLQGQIAIAANSLGVSLEPAAIPLTNYGQDLRTAPISKVGIAYPTLPTTLDGIERPEAIDQPKFSNWVNYQCPLALQLAPRFLPGGVSRASPIEIIKIAEKFRSHLPLTPEISWQSQVLPSGIINFSLSNRSLADWLENLRLDFLRLNSPKGQITIDGSPKLNPAQKNPDYFPLQYTHARCCSLLRLAAAEGLVHLQGQGKIAETPKIPWLDRHNTWQLVTPQAQQLINQLVNLVDEFDINTSEEPSSPTQRKKRQKLSTKISLSFEEFYRYNRIFGAECRENFPLAQARLGLVALTQGGLQKLLEEYLGAIAPPEL